MFELTQAEKWAADRADHRAAIAELEKDVCECGHAKINHAGSTTDMADCYWHDCEACGCEHFNLD